VQTTQWSKEKKEAMFPKHYTETNDKGTITPLKRG